LVTIPGLISISSPIFIIPLSRVPPMTPPIIYFIFVLGLFTSNERIIIIFGSTFIFLLGIGIYSAIYYKAISMLYYNYAEIGIIGEF